MKYAKPRQLADAISVTTDALRKQRERGKSYRLNKDGYVINFGVIFDVVAHKFANKAEVKLRCINKIKDYFHIDKMKFNQGRFCSCLY